LKVYNSIIWLYGNFLIILSSSWVFENTAFLLTIRKHFDRKLLIFLDIACNQRNKFNPNAAKAGGLQSQGVKGEGCSRLPRSLDNTGSEVLWLSRRVNNMAKSTPSFEFTNGDIHKMLLSLLYRVS
jgi:hypothetical protein